MPGSTLALRRDVLRSGRCQTTVRLRQTIDVNLVHRWPIPAAAPPASTNLHYLTMTAGGVPVDDPLMNSVGDSGG